MRYLYSLLLIVSIISFLLPFTYDLGLINFFSEEFLNKYKNYLPNFIFFIFIISFSTFLYLFSKDRVILVRFSNIIENKLLKFGSNKINEINELTYLLVLSIIFSLIYIIFFEKTILVWSTISEIPILIRLQDPSYLTNDFFTNSITESPKIIFGHLINYLNFFGISWLPALYFLKVASIILIPLLLFKTYKNISNLWFSDKLKIKYGGLINQSIFLLSFGFIGLLQLFPQMFPFGWGAMELTYSIDPMKAAFTFGLLFLCIYSSRNNYPFLISLILLFISSILHPVIGISIYIISLLFIFSGQINIIKVRESVILALFGIIFPSLMMMVLFDNSSFLSSYEFLDIYVKLRHPHHYLASEILNIYTLMWIFLLLIPIYLSKLVRDRKLLILSILVFISIISSVLLQFVFTEIFPSKLIMKIGPTRFTSFCSIMLSINLIILLPSLFEYINNKEHKKSFFYQIIKLLSVYISYFSFKLQKFLRPKLIQLACIPLLIFLVFGLTFDNKIDNYLDSSDLEITDWIENNTAKDDMIFSPEFDTFLVRIVSERSIYADFSFPFSERYMREFSDRYKFYLESKNLKISDYECFKNSKKQIDYIILSNRLRDKIKPIFSNELWSIYDARIIYCAN